MKTVLKHPSLKLILLALGTGITYILAASLPSFFPERYQLIVYPLGQMGLILLYALLVKKLLGKPFVLGFRGDTFREALLLASPMLIAVAINMFEFCNVAVLYDPVVESRDLPFVLLQVLLNGLRPGVVEEVLFRCLVTGSIMHFAANKPFRIPLAVFLPAVCFGLIHLVNLTVGQSLEETLFQVLYATAFGVLLGGAYARTRNLPALILLHALVDVIPICKTMLYQPPAAPTSVADVCQYIALTLILLGFGFCSIRRSTWTRIEALWDGADTDSSLLQPTSCG